MRIESRAPLTDAEWSELGVPVGLAFFVQNSRTQRATAFYPSPAGAVEAELPPEAWSSLAEKSRVFAEVRADVEGVLVQRQRRGGGQVYLAPIDACYQLVAIVRTRWRGFDGGDEAWQAIDAFFAALAARGEPIPPGGAR